MRRQNHDHDCGPAAVANAFEFHHKKIGLRGLRDLTGCEPNGTDEDGVLRALLAYGCEVDEHKGDDPRRAWVWLLESVHASRAVLLCVDRWDHWITVIGTAGRDLVVYDPVEENGGTFVLRFKSLRSRWEAARRVRGKGPKFYGIAAGPPAR